MTRATGATGTTGATGAGLCETCAHARLITSSKGSEFVMCQLSATDDRFPKYPALPVLRCEGYSRILFPDR